MVTYAIELFYRPKSKDAIHFDCIQVVKSGRNKAEALRLAYLAHGLPVFYNITKLERWKILE